MRTIAAGKVVRQVLVQPEPVRERGEAARIWPFARMNLLG